MLEFAIISGLGTIAVKKICTSMLTKHGKDRGYVYSFYKLPEMKMGPVGKTASFLFNFVPGVNILISAIMVGGTCWVLASPNVDKDQKHYKGPDINMDAFYANNYYEYLDSQLKGIDDAMKLDGATPEVVNEEMKKAEEEVYSTSVKLSEKKRRELEAMSDTALWLRDMELENGLSYEERGELFPVYTDDFMNPRENAKPKAIQKTMKLVDKRQK